MGKALAFWIKLSKFLVPLRSDMVRERKLAFEKQCLRITSGRASQLLYFLSRFFCFGQHNFRTCGVFLGFWAVMASAVTSPAWSVCLLWNKNNKEKRRIARTGIGQQKTSVCRFLTASLWPAQNTLLNVEAVQREQKLLLTYIYRCLHGSNGNRLLLCVCSSRAVHVRFK